MIRAALALHEATGRARLSRAGARLAGGRSTATTPIPATAAISSPPTTPRAWWCARAPPPTTPRRTRMRSRRRTWCGSRHSPASMPGASRPTGCSTASSPAPATICSRTLRCSTRSTCACAPPRSSWSGEDSRADTLLAAARKLPFLDRIVLRAPRMRCRPRIRRRPRSAAAQSAAFVCVGETCSLPVTDPAALVAALTTARPHVPG